MFMLHEELLVVVIIIIIIRQLLYDMRLKDLVILVIVTEPHYSIRH